jgi:hypothetical protein
MEKKTIKERYYTIVNSINGVQRNAVNPFTKSKYPTLSNIQKELMPQLAKENCYLHFDFGSFAEEVYKVKLTLLAWDIDDEITWNFAVPIDSSQKNRVQAFGATTTFAQRYCLCVAFHIPIDDEDPDAQQRDNQKPYLKPGDPKWDKAVDYIVNHGNDGWAYTMSKFNITEQDLEKLEAEVKSKTV